MNRVRILFGARLSPLAPFLGICTCSHLWLWHVAVWNAIAIVVLAISAFADCRHVCMTNGGLEMVLSANDRLDMLSLQPHNSTALPMRDETLRLLWYNAHNACGHGTVRGES